MLTESSYELLAFVVTTFIVLVYVVANFFSTPKTTIKIVSFLILHTESHHKQYITINKYIVNILQL